MVNTEFLHLLRLNLALVSGHFWSDRRYWGLIGSQLLLKERLLLK